MEAGKGSSNPLYAVGDLVTDGENSGVVLSRAADPRDGEPVYLAMGIGGTLLSLYARDITDGVTRESAPTVDAAGRHPLATATASAATLDGLAEVSGANREAVLFYLDYAGHYVEENASADSLVARAFQTYHAECNSSAAGPSPHTLFVTLDVWRTCEFHLRQRILNGWNPSTHVPRLPDMSINAVSRALVASIGAGESGVFFAPETVINSGMIEPVTVQIHEGFTREKALGALRQILAALESAWDKAVALPDGEYLTEEVKENTLAGPAATKKPQTATPHSRKLGGKERPKAKAVAA